MLSTAVVRAYLFVSSLTLIMVFSIWRKCPHSKQLRTAASFTPSVAVKQYPKNFRTHVSTLPFTSDCLFREKAACAKNRGDASPCFQGSTVAKIPRMSCYNRRRRTFRAMFVVRLLGVLALVALNGFFAATRENSVAAKK